LEIFSTLTSGLSAFAENPFMLVLLVVGVFFGMVFGAIPGLTAALGVTLILPFTYSMAPSDGLTTLIAIYVGGISGGLISACLLNIPGSPASLVTCFDGAPMARNGRPADALALGVFASLIGGIFSGMVMVIVAPQLAKVALMFGSWEYFALGIMGLMVVVSICSNNMIKGLLSAVIGLLLGTVGMDPVSSVQRLTFGVWQLNAGFSLLATLMGLFALCEILVQTRDLGVKFNILDTGKIRLFPKKELISGKSKIRCLGVSSVIGTIIGILPGIGQSTASMLAYNTARQMSDQPEKFGTGCEEGVIASEAANNAVCGGAMIPMMTLGIPGDTVTAILLGGLVVHGLQPGPLLFTNNADIVGIIFVAYLISCVVMYFMEMGLMKMFIKLLKIPLNLLLPVILVMCVVGTFTTNNRIFDILVFFFIGILGYVLVSNGFPLAPTVLGYILAKTIESNMRTGLVSSGGSFRGFFESPLAVCLVLFGLVLLLLPGVMSRLKKHRAAK